MVDFARNHPARRKLLLPFVRQTAWDSAVADQFDSRGSQHRSRFWAASINRHDLLAASRDGLRA
jgi:hypothetical protein